MIAVDAMGGDNAPIAIVNGALAAARSGIPILLIGKEQEIMPLLPTNWQKLPLSFEFTSDIITMADDPSKAVRSRPNASLVRAVKAVAQGRASAFFSAGNSGAVLIASVLFIGRINGVNRPAVGAFLPTRNSSFFCLDVGANVECKASYFYQFALMGHCYLQIICNIKNPRIGLLSNGHESYKGTQEIKKAYSLLVQSPLNFIGNIESRDLGDDVVDLLICDGFVGNVLLKAMQGFARTMFYWIKKEADGSMWNSFLLWLSRPMWRNIKRRLDYTSIGGALMLGVKQPVILAHGSSDARAIENGIKFAHTIVQQKQLERFNIHLKQLFDQSHTFSGAVKQKMRSFFHWRNKGKEDGRPH